jgi:hypothetical protein
MMRWNPETVAVDVVATEQEQEKVNPMALLQALFASFASLGARSLVVTAVVTLLVVALLLGMSAEDALAGHRWCASC